MAWNEPGGGKKENDPWGNRGGDQGPPDLEEALRKFQQQLSGIFGGGGSSGGGGGGLSAGMFGLIAVVAVVAYLGLGVYQVDQQERGVVFRFGEVKEAVVMPGLHWNPPLVDRVEKVNVTRLMSHEHQAEMLTQDENIVNVKLSVQYVVEDPISYLVKIREPELSLGHATESALRHVVGSSSMDGVLTEGREALGIEVHERLQTYLRRYETGILVSTVNIDSTSPPEQVRDAFDDVTKAKEDEVRYVNEANAYSESVIPDARGKAQKALEQANAYRDQVTANSTGEAERFKKLLAEYQLAKRVTRDRLYIDSIESVLKNSTKVMVDVEGGNNMMYLPLDRMNRSGGGAAAGVDDDTVQDLTDAIVRELNNRAQANRRRESR